MSTLSLRIRISNHSVKGRTILVKILRREANIESNLRKKSMSLSKVINYLANQVENWKNYNVDVSQERGCVQC